MGILVWLPITLSLSTPISTGPVTLAPNVADLSQYLIMEYKLRPLSKTSVPLAHMVVSICPRDCLIALL